ncbi:hypothetical protein M378DRAFT_1006610 [Amanita muscaria Koide BX008]|uniref:Uncharacterized protein n=1 Tax=Amanita muscaria (strain Koide BX008) TaxID=946122 RepID=A0A0C2WRU3_AMAMK|nr:hypothetical protein M378DRAFT_1006610 [Amanita muscaria Koide BX008]
MAVYYCLLNISVHVVIIFSTPESAPSLALLKGACRCRPEPELGVHSYHSLIGRSII